MGEMEESVKEVEELNNIISNTFCKAAEEVIGKGKISSRKKAVPWWTDECSKAIILLNKALKKVRKNYVFNGVIQYKRKQAIVWKVCKKKLLETIL